MQKIAQQYDQFEYLYTDVAELDITNPVKVQECFDEYRPVACINAAAYTAVDKAESDKELALKINATAVSILAENCSRHHTKFIHISTDYVFDGNGTSPYLEDHKLDPVNYYGYTKLKGEEAAAINKDTVIIRTSWVYSFFGNNFVKTMMRLMSERDTLNVVSDQYGSPTYAADLAEAIFLILTTDQFTPGIYHYSNEGNINWFDFAIAIRDTAGLTCDINPVETSGYPTPAKRPAYSVMSKDKISKTYDIKIKNWKESLGRCIKLLQN